MTISSKLVINILRTLIHIFIWWEIKLIKIKSNNLKFHNKNEENSFHSPPNLKRPELTRFHINYWD